MNIRDYKATGIALGIIVVALATSRGGLSALMPLLRFALPFIAIVLAYKFIKGKLIGAVQDMQQRGPGGQGGQSGQGMGGQGAGKVIDLCPKCGKYMTGNHRCS